MKKPKHSQEKAPGRSGTTPFPDPTALRKQAEQKAKNMTFPDLDSMTKAEIREAFYEMQVSQIETELENRHLREGLEQYEETASQREKKYRLLFEQSPLGVFHIDSLEKCRYRHVSGQASRTGSISIPQARSIKEGAPVKRRVKRKNSFPAKSEKSLPW